MSQLPGTGASPAGAPTCAFGLRGRWSPGSSVKAASADPDVPRRQNPTELRWKSHAQDPFFPSAKRHFSSHHHCCSFIAAPRRAQTAAPPYWLTQQIETVSSQSERDTIHVRYFSIQKFCRASLSDQRKTGGDKNKHRSTSLSPCSCFRKSRRVSEFSDLLYFYDVRKIPNACNKLHQLSS